MLRYDGRLELSLLVGIIFGVSMAVYYFLFFGNALISLITGLLAGLLFGGAIYLIYPILHRQAEAELGENEELLAKVPANLLRGIERRGWIIIYYRFEALF